MQLHLPLSLLCAFGATQAMAGDDFTVERDPFDLVSKGLELPRTVFGLPRVGAFMLIERQPLI